MSNKNVSTHKETLNRMTPNFLIKIGVILNIIFCSIMSLILPLVIITIPAIALNGLLLVPRVDTKRYYAVWRIIPIFLVLLLTTIILLSFFFLITFAVEAYSTFAEFIDKYIIFWRRSPVMPSADVGTWFEITMGVIGGLGVSGSVFISLGWYKKKEIGIIEKTDK